MICTPLFRCNVTPFTLVLPKSSQDFIQRVGNLYSEINTEFSKVGFLPTYIIFVLNRRVNLWRHFSDVTINKQT
jgi:hypothetical protein